MPRRGEHPAEERIPKIVEHTFVGLAQFLAVVEAKCPGIAPMGWVYRGQADARLPLLPKAGRRGYYLRPIERLKRKAHPPRDICKFNLWRKLAVAYCDYLPENDFECLAYAQHYGLATRLLDWTTNPLVALYFAVESITEIDGAVCCYLAEGFVDLEKARLGYSPERVARLDPRPFDRRILAQSGVFTYHPEPNVPLSPGNSPSEFVEFGDAEPELSAYITPDGTNLIMLRVKAETKVFLQRQLSEVGVSRKSLFPDLEGLSQFINWDSTRSAARDAKESDPTTGAPS